MGEYGVSTFEGVGKNFGHDLYETAATMNHEAGESETIINELLYSETLFQITTIKN